MIFFNIYTALSTIVYISLIICVFLTNPTENSEQILVWCVSTTVGLNKIVTEESDQYSKPGPL